MTWLRAKFALTLACLLVAAVARAQTSEPMPPQMQGKTVAEIATLIADGIETATPKRADAPVAFQSAAAHDNVVELRYSVEQASFNELSDGLSQVRHVLASRLCAPNRIWALNSGVVFVHIWTLRDSSERQQIRVDLSVCAGLA